MSTASRRLRSVPALFLAAVLLVVTLPLWLVVAGLFDLVRGKLRLPTVRLLGFALCWSWLETCGVLVAFGLWLAGRKGDVDAHFRLQRWWAARLMAALRTTTGIRVGHVDTAPLGPGPVVMRIPRRYSSSSGQLPQLVTAPDSGWCKPSQAI